MSPGSSLPRSRHRPVLRRCCTEHSLRTAWTSDDDPRGHGFLPCDWGFESAEEALAGCKGGGGGGGGGGEGGGGGGGEGGSGGEAGDSAGERRLGGVGEGNDGLGGAGERGSLTAGRAIQAVCVLSEPPATATADTDADLALLRQWIRNVLGSRKATGVAAVAAVDDVLVLSSAAAVETLARQLRVTHRHVAPTAASAASAAFTWAGAAAACVAAAHDLLTQVRRPVVLSTAAVQWWRDPSPWVHCSGADAGTRQCAPLGPADAMVASEMLSAKQDALFGGGFAKYGGLDPSVLVLRPTAAGQAVARAWEAALRTEHGSISRAASAATTTAGSSGGSSQSSGMSMWAARAGALFRQVVVAGGAGGWPGLEEVRALGRMRQNSPSRTFDDP